MANSPGFASIISHVERWVLPKCQYLLLLASLLLLSLWQGMGEFKVDLSDVLVAWKYLLQDKLHLPLDNLIRPENYDLILKAYESFLKGSNTVDLVDVRSHCSQLRGESVPAQSVNPVSCPWLKPGSWFGEIR